MSVMSVGYVRAWVFLQGHLSVADAAEPLQGLCPDITRR